MLRRIIDRTGIETSVIGFGTGSLHHLFQSRDRLRLLEEAYSLGITHFDTSPYYGFGLAEKDLRCFAKCRRDSVTITTKIGLYPPLGGSSSVMVGVRKAIGKVAPFVSRPVIDWTLSAAKKNFERSMRRLGTEYVDFLFLHEPIFSSIMCEDFIKWLEELQTAGKIRTWGVAGLASSIEKPIALDHRLCEVIQTKDSLDLQEAEFILDRNRCLQFTYGYMSRGLEKQSMNEVFSKLLKRNATGTVIVSTRRVQHLRQLVESVG
jgi:aryl-alcohol dehydrogenase-like predicted oxidoreductase